MSAVSDVQAMLPWRSTIPYMPTCGHIPVSCVQGRFVMSAAFSVISKHIPMSFVISAWFVSTSSHRLPISSRTWKSTPVTCLFVSSFECWVFPAITVLFCTLDTGNRVQNYVHVLLVTTLSLSTQFSAALDLSTTFVPYRSYMLHFVSVINLLLSFWLTVLK